jgi:hypothetical protein
MLREVLLILTVTNIDMIVINHLNILDYMAPFGRNAEETTNTRRNLIQTQVIAHEN